MRRTPTILLAGLLPWWCFAQLTVDPMTPVTACGSTTMNVPFSAASSYNAGNVFTMELSDAAGSFAAPAVIGSAAGIGSGVIPCTFPAGIGGGGWAIRVVASDPAETGDAYVLPIATLLPPDAGTSSSIAVCSNEPPFNMLTQLGGSPQAGGSWTGPNGASQPGVFQPAISLAGCYTYTVAAAPPCSNASSVLCVTVSDAPTPGSNIDFSACGGPPIDMQAGLPPGGTWTFGGAPHSNIFTPGIDTPGPYVYTLPGVPPCTGVTYTAWMMIDMPPNAGTSANVNWCASFGPLDLYAQLGGTPDGGGTWTDDSGTGALSGGTFDPAGIPNGIYLFTYTVPASGMCQGAQATVVVTNTAACMVPPETNDPVE